MKNTRRTKNGDQASFLAQVSNLWPVAKGSVAEVHKPCTRSGCRACAEGRGHRAFIFSHKDGNRRRCLYVPANKVDAMRKAIANGRRIEELLSKAGRQIIINGRLNRK
jgi:hypothetical protein